MVLVGLIALSLASSCASPGLTAAAESFAFVPSSLEGAPSGQLELAPVVEERRWYGYQLLLSDMAAIGVTVFGVDVVLQGTPSCPYSPSCHTAAGAALIGIGAGIFGLVPPIIHLAHGQYWNAAGSFGLRVVIPALTGLAFQGTGGMGLLWIELLIAMIIDDAYLADEPIPRPSPSRVELGEATAPSSHGSVGLGYRGHF